MAYFIYSILRPQLEKNVLNHCPVILKVYFYTLFLLVMRVERCNIVDKHTPLGDEYCSV